MDDTKTTGNASKFTKTRHRPWEKKLLEDKISQSSHANIENNIAVELDQNYTKQRQVLERHESETKSKAELVTKISNIDDEPILIGGIFRPHQFICSQTDHRREEVGALIDKFQRKNNQLQSLTTELKVLEAQESAQKAEQAKAAEERLRKASEIKMQEVMRQLQEATKEIHLALQRAQESDIQAKKEHSLRKEVQISLEEYRLKNESLGKHMSLLENENKDLEMKAKQSIEKVIELEATNQDTVSNYQNEISSYQDEISEYQNELERVSAERDSQEERSKAFANQRDEYQKMLTSKEKEILDITRESTERINGLKERIDEKDSIVLAAQKEKLVLNDNISELSLSNASLSNEIEKLKEILKVERKLRKDAEAKATNAQEKAVIAEKQRAASQKKAQQAIKRANQTVMKFINQGDDSLDAEDDEEQYG